MRLSKVLENTNNEQIDFVLTSVPWTESKLPLMAPAALKPVIEKAGLTCKAVDLNADVQIVVNDYKNPDDLINFFYNEDVDNPDSATLIHNLFFEVANDILSYNPKYVGLSLLTYVSQTSTKWLSYYIKKINPNVKIIIGGPGCLDDSFVGQSEFVNFVKNNNLVDYHIRGDAEHSLYELLIGNEKYPGIDDDTWKEMSKEEIEKIPTPDYKDYSFDLYQLKAMPLMGSRGCVRRCKFCDYIENWKKFQWRDADDIFGEMLYQSKKYNITTFVFRDSLTNGNMNEFVSLMEKIADYNDKNADKKFTWAGYYVFRNVTTRSEYEWELVKRSGASLLMVGIENFNEDIRFDVGKKFTNEAIDFHLEQALKHNIRLNLLNIVGWVSEEEHHIDFAKSWLDTHTKYKDIIEIQWGSGLGIFPHTYLDKNKDKLGIKMIANQKPFEWISTNLQNTPKTRANWTKELMEYSKECGYTVTENLDNHFIIEKVLNAENTDYY